MPKIKKLLSGGLLTKAMRQVVKASQKNRRSKNRRDD
jgi:hypothetical protein